MSQQLHSDALFAIIETLNKQAEQGDISMLNLYSVSLPLYKEILKRISDESAQNKHDIFEISEKAKWDKAIIKGLRSLLDEHTDFIDHMQLRDSYHDFCMAEMRKKLGKQN